MDLGNGETGSQEVFPWERLGLPSGPALGCGGEMGHSLSAGTILILFSAGPPPPTPHPLMLLALQLWGHADSIPDLGTSAPVASLEGPNRRSKVAQAGSPGWFQITP